MSENAKPWYYSKTNWLNIAAFFTTLFAALAQVLPSIQGLLSLETYIIISVVVNITNLVLRNYFTTKAIK